MKQPLKKKKEIEKTAARTMSFRAGRPHDLFDGEGHGGMGGVPPQEAHEKEKTAACTMLFRAGRPHYPFRVFRV